MRKKLLGFFLLTLLQVTVVFGQDKRITGRVTNSLDGTPIPGVSVIIQGTTTGTQTDADGRYIIKAPGGSVLLFRSIGFGTKTVTVGDATSVDIGLEATTDELSEVVVVAYGKVKKESITGSVTSVAAKDIEKRPITNVMGALEGSAAGIQVNNTTGQPGSEPTIRIRGTTSINGDNSPLYIIDGVFFGGNISDLNPNDIASISVLKDAAASALYGNRASNGVIIITTKRASKSGDAGITVVANQGIYSRGVKEYNVMNQQEFMETMWKGYRNSLMTNNPATYPNKEVAGAKATESLIDNYLTLNIYDKPNDQLFDANGKLVADARIRPGYLDDLNWFNDIETQGHRQDYSISGRSNSNKSSLYYSVGYLDEKGYLKGSNYKRFTGRVNADLQAKDWLKYGFNLSGSHQQSDRLPGGTGSAGSIVSPFNFARSAAPIYPVHLHDPATGEYVLDEEGQKRYDDGSNTRSWLPGRNAIWENELNKDKVYRNTINGQVYFDIKFLKDFTFSVKGDLNLRNSDNHTYSNAVIGDGQGNKGRAERNNYRYMNYTAQQLLTWARAFNQHNVDVMIGHENFYDNYNYLNGYKTNETFANQLELINFTAITRLTDYQHNYRTEGYFARARYNYDEKYYIDGSIRRDGTSRFSKDARWGTFFSLGGSWLISKEDFFQPISHVVNYAKLRASYGEVGNDAGVGSTVLYPYMALYTLGQNANVAALYKSQLSALALHWETSSSVTAALETRLFNRANLTVEYFDKRSQNLLLDVNLPLSAGATSTSEAAAIIRQNVGSVSNKGLEVSLDVDVVKTKDWTWNVGAHATWMKNEIVRLSEQNKNGIIDGNYKYTVGHGIYDWWTYQFAGVDQMTGNSLYVLDSDTYKPDATTGEHLKYLVNINGTYYTTYHTYAKRDFVGSPMPKMFGGISTALTYKNFSLSALMTYATEFKIYDDSYLDLRTMSGTPESMHKDLLRAWDGVPAGMTETSPNRIDPKGIPVVDFARSQYNNVMSSQFLQNGSYLVIKNISLTYNLPSSLLNKIDISSVRLNAGVENLATFTKLRGMNPQQQFNGRSVNAWVTPRVVSFGVTVGL
ncbi:SusC/RagA family TonB-linked outer membrane protein [Chitinophaga sp.]|uniref:SusC/RagA family TonB-linked outer membrane protein n=1 Tax=Chitinophaga sp. TaxID=1869181 RepID=UPI0031DBEBD8